MEDGGETIVSARQECIAAGHRSGLVGFSLLPTSDLRRQRHREFGMGRSSIMDPVPLQEISRYHWVKNNDADMTPPQSINHGRNNSGALLRFRAFRSWYCSLEVGLSDADDYGPFWHY